jgi:hypothetical protein
MKKFIISEDEKRHIKGLYLINEQEKEKEVPPCPQEKFNIVDGTETIKKEIDRNGLTEYVTVNPTKTFNVNRYCNGKIEHSYMAYIERGKLVLSQHID